MFDFKLIHSLLVVHVSNLYLLYELKLNPVSRPGIHAILYSSVADSSLHSISSGLTEQKNV